MSLAIGNIIGPQFFLDSQSPTYPLGIGATIFAFALMAATGIAYYALCIVENRRRNLKYGQSVSLQDEDDIACSGGDGEDATDWENTGFRYTY